MRGGPGAWAVLAITGVLLPSTAMAALEGEAESLLRGARVVTLAQVACEGPSPPWSAAVASERGAMRISRERPLRVRDWARIRNLLLAHASYERAERCYAPGWPYVGKDAPVAALNLTTDDGPVRIVFLLDEGCAQILVAGTPRGVLGFSDAIGDLAPLLNLRVPAARPSARVAPAPPPPPFEVSDLERLRPTPIVLPDDTHRASMPPVRPARSCAGDSALVGIPERPPELVESTPPPYPGSAREANVDGTVIVEALVNCSGWASELRVLKSIPMLDQAVLDAFQSWKFRPASLSRVAVKTWTSVAVRFELTGGTGTVVVEAPPVRSAAGTCAGDTVLVGVPDQLPVAITKVPPTYPDMAREANVDGTVMVEFEVDCLGRVAAARVVKSIPMLDQAALDAAKKWIFTPARWNGRVVRASTTIPIRFTLN